MTKGQRGRSSALSLLLVAMVACQGGDQTGRPTDSQTGPADLVLRNGAVYTVDEGRPWAEAVAVKDGIITVVGSNADVAELVGPTTEVVDLAGDMVLPGFQDTHTHIQEASSLAWTCGLERNTPPMDLVARMSRCRPNGSEWVLGWGFSINTLISQIQRGGKTPAEVLDMALPNTPAVMMEETSHAAWVNSAGLKRAGINARTPSPPGGVIVRDRRTGEPTGLLLDSAGDQVFELALRRTDELVDVQANGLRWGLKQLGRYGITSVADARVYWKRADLEVWKRAEQQGWLTARATLGLWAYPEMDDDEQLAKLAAMYDPNPEGLVHVSQVKLYDDGITLNGTAAMLEPYERSFLKQVAPLGLGSKDGINYFEQGRLDRYTTELEKVGFDMHIHVLGDRGTHEALNAIETAIEINGPDIDRRHRLTHLELVDEGDIPRFADLGVIADMQVSGNWTKPEAWSYNEQFIGDRGDNFIPLRSIYDTGAKVTLSSDWDVSTMDPLVGIEHSLTRDPQSLPDLAAAIRAYTLTPAYTLRQEATTGSIEVGKAADLVVLDANLFEVPVDQISNASVVLTYFDGEEVYRASSAPG